MDQSDDSKCLVMESDCKISELIIPDIIEPKLEENIKEKSFNRSVESLFKEENLGHARHYSDPGQKSKTKSKIGKDRRISRSFTEGKRENKQLRRGSIPDQKQGT